MYLSELTNHNRKQCTIFNIKKCIQKNVKTSAGIGYDISNPRIYE